MIFRSVARVIEDRPDTHRLRLADDVDDDDEDEVAFDLLLVLFELLPAVDFDDDSGNTGDQRADRNVCFIWMHVNGGVGG